MLGLEPHEVVGRVGMSLMADTPENKQRVHELFASIGQGSSRGDVVIELRRKDDGRPVWVPWYSRPEPNGKYTRTVLVDITEHVLAEQERARLQEQNLYLQEEIKGIHNFEEIIGQSPALTAVLENVRRVAEVFKRDVPDAVVRFFDTGHFALETHAVEIASSIREFFMK
jgi:PAS domain S-box-containing protein